MSEAGASPVRGLIRRSRRVLRRLTGMGKAVAGSVRWGDFGRVRPIGLAWGHERGTPVDRPYIEEFLSQHRGDISGCVLEVRDAGYSRQFGGDRVTRQEVLDIDRANPHATIFVDLNDAHDLPHATFDCIVFTQTLQLIYEFHSALRSLERSLAPGGTLLLTVPGLSRVPALYPWYWSFTRDSIERLLADAFPAAEIAVSSYGNVKTATAFLHGLGREELRRADYACHDPVFPVIIAARVRKR